MWEYILIIMDIIIINVKAIDIIYCDKHWNTEWLTQLQTLILVGQCCKWNREYTSSVSER